MQNHLREFRTFGHERGAGHKRIIADTLDACGNFNGRKIIHIAKRLSADAL